MIKLVKKKGSSHKRRGLRVRGGFMTPPPMYVPRPVKKVYKKKPLAPIDVFELVAEHRKYQPGSLKSKSLPKLIEMGKKMLNDSDLETAIVRRGKEFINTIVNRRRTETSGGQIVVTTNKTVKPVGKMAFQHFGASAIHKTHNIFGNPNVIPSRKDATSLKSPVFKSTHLRNTYTGGTPLFAVDIDGILDKSTCFTPLRSDVGGKLVSILPPITTALPSYLLRSACTAESAFKGGSTESISKNTSSFTNAMDDPNNTGTNAQGLIKSTGNTTIKPYFPYIIHNELEFTNVNQNASCFVTVHWVKHTGKSSKNPARYFYERVYGGPMIPNTSDVNYDLAQNLIPDYSKAFLSGGVVYPNSGSALDYNNFDDVAASGVADKNASCVGNVGFVTDTTTLSPLGVALDNFPQQSDPGIFNDALTYLTTQDVGWNSAFESTDSVFHAKARLDMRLQSAYSITGNRGFKENFEVIKTDKKKLAGGEVWSLKSDVYKNHCFDNYTNLNADAARPWSVDSDTVFPIIEVVGIKAPVMQFLYDHDAPVVGPSQRSEEHWFSATVPANVAINCTTSITNYSEFARLDREAGQFPEQLANRRLFYSKIYQQDYTNKVFSGRNPVIAYSKLISSQSQLTSSGAYVNIPLMNPAGEVVSLAPAVERNFTNA